ncbi:MAG: hypothetical protein RIM80_25955 [Alphaproteobacteria bacterium]
MGKHRLASLRHRRQQFERQLTAELSNKQPDAEAMRFFEEQKRRIADLIGEIESSPAEPSPRRQLAETIHMLRASA